MRTRTGRGTALAVATAGLLLGVGTAWAVNIQIGSTTVPSQGTGTITVTVDPQGDGVVATLNDTKFPANGEVIVQEQTVSATLASDITADADMIPLSEGDADSLPSFGLVVIEGEEISYSMIMDDTLIVAARGATPAAHTAGTAVTVPTRVPECAATTDITNLNKEVVFSYLPDGCTPGTDCVGIRAIVIALDNLDEITSTTAVYQCTVKTNQDDGEFTLECPQVGVACTSNDECETTETCNTTAGNCVPNAPFQPAQSGDSPLQDPPVGNLPTTCTNGAVGVGVSSCLGDFRDPLGTVTADEAAAAILAFGRGEPDLNPGADTREPKGVVTADEAAGSVLNFGRGECNP